MYNWSVIFYSLSESNNERIKQPQYRCKYNNQYGGVIVQDFDTEYVDVVIKTLVQLRLYTARLQKEIKNWLIRSQYDLELFLSGMQELSDKLNTLMRENGMIRNNFEYGLREIDQSLHMMIEEIAIK